jgi:SAM-dependent methyltransferase
MNPQPEVAAVARRYQDAYGADYLAYEQANEASFLGLQELALSDAGFFDLEGAFFAQGRHALLDVGCATGALLALLRDRGWETTGVEICTPAQGYARDVRQLDVRGLPLEENRFPDGGFDVVLASHVIEHLNNPGGFVREVYRILRPGGRFLVTTPNIEGFQARLFRHRWRSAIFDHLFLFSVKTLSRLLIDAGFRVLRVRTWGGLAAGSAPKVVKGLCDRGAKAIGLGDVMILHATTCPGGILRGR